MGLSYLAVYHIKLIIIEMRGSDWIYAGRSHQRSKIMGVLK